MVLLSEPPTVIMFELWYQRTLSHLLVACDNTADELGVIAGKMITSKGTELQYIHKGIQITTLELCQSISSNNPWWRSHLWFLRVSVQNIGLL